MQLTIIKNDSLLKVVHNARTATESAHLQIVHKRINRGVVQLITSIN